MPIRVTGPNLLVPGACQAHALHKVTIFLILGQHLAFQTLLRFLQALHQWQLYAKACQMARCFVASGRCWQQNRWNGCELLLS